MGKRKEDPQEDIVNVDFDFFDLVEDDFLSIKNLVRQLLGPDNFKFNLSEITSQLLKFNVGMTIKADDEEYNDALAVFALAEFDLNQHEFDLLFSYFVDRANNALSLGFKPAANLLKTLHFIKTKKNLLLISERFLNMPFDVVPPLYSLLSEEIKKHKINCDYIVIPTRFYSERLSGNGKGDIHEEVFPFHEEDVVIEKVSLAFSRYNFEKEILETDSRRAFQDSGIYPYGGVIVVDAKRFGELGGGIERFMQENS